jgi:hypothetical protein
MSPQIACEAYDRIEIPEIKPDVTRVTLFGGTCPCCAKPLDRAEESHGGVTHTLTHIRAPDATAFTIIESICRTALSGG